MQSNSRQGPPLLLVAAGVVALVLIGRVVLRAVAPLIVPVLVVLAGLAAAVMAAAVVRFARAPIAAKRNYPRAWQARCTWRHTARNLGLAHVDPHGRKTARRSAGEKQLPAGRVRYPRARFAATEHGVAIRVRTTAKASRPEFEKAAPYLAGLLGCERVSVGQERPGRLRLHALRTDPLSVAYGAEQVAPSLRADPWNPFIGTDEWGLHRHISLSGIPGILIAGNPGMGKTSAVLWLLDQLAGSPAVQLAVIDGKDGGDFTAWRDRAWLSCGDELADAAGVLEDVHAEMRRRLKVLASYSGPRNRWHVGPTAEWPLIVTLIDEASTFFDLDAVKGDKEREAHVRACRSLAGQCIKKGRSPLHLTVLLSQRTTVDNTPAALRDLCGLALCFGVSTRASAVAALGESIRDYPTYDPAAHREPGVCTATLPCGLDPYVRLRVPEVSQAAGEARAAETAHLRADPSHVQSAGLPVLPMPAEVAS
jgi:DNA segregation ATPase FtsK/SpoIIIE, S-DNA-T family